MVIPVNHVIVILIVELSLQNALQWNMSAQTDDSRETFKLRNVPTTVLLLFFASKQQQHIH